MAQLIVCGLDEEIVDRLRKKAAANGISSEEQHRRILRDALVPEGETLKDLLLRIPQVGKDADFERIPSYSPLPET